MTAQAGDHMQWEPGDAGSVISLRPFFRVALSAKTLHSSIHACADNSVVQHSPSPSNASNLDDHFGGGGKERFTDCLANPIADGKEPDATEAWLCAGV